MSDVENEKTLEKVNYAQEAAQLTEPFTMIDLAQVDDLSLSVFLCQGTGMPFHRHLDQDELFMVHSGTISVDSDWGNVVLRHGELSVVSKGLSHRSSSLIRSLVLLFQPRLLVNRRNGDRHLFSLKNAGHLEKVSIPAMGRQIVNPHTPVTLANLDTFALNLLLCTETGDWRRYEGQSSLVLCYAGDVIVDSDLGRESLQGGELLVVPKGTAYRLSSRGRSLVLELQRHKPPGLPSRD
jgi:homogentisate 1,2-dioxygenase